MWDLVDCYFLISLNFFVLILVLFVVESYYGLFVNNVEYVVTLVKCIEWSIFLIIFISW